MKSRSISIFLKVLLITWVFNFLFVFSAQSQAGDTEETDQEAVELVEGLISLDAVPVETERIANRIIDLRAVLAPKSQVQEIDSALTPLELIIVGKRDSLLMELGTISRKKLQIREVEWGKYRSLIKKYQKTIGDRTEEINLINDELVGEIRKWTLTKETISNDVDTGAVYKSFDNVILTLQNTLTTTLTRVDSVFVIQNRLTKLVLVCDEVISELANEENEMRSNYFVFDSAPIWSAHNDSLALATQQDSKLEQVKEGVKDDREALVEFFTLNIEIVVIQVLFILLFLALMLFVRKRWKIEKDTLASTVEIDTRTVLRRPIASTLVVGVLTSAFFYDALFPFLVVCHILLILMGTIVLLPELTVNKFRKFLLLCLFVYILYFIDSYFDQAAMLSRWLLIGQVGIMLVGLRYAKQIIEESPNQFDRMYKLSRFMVPTYTIVLTVSLVANVIGLVSMSRFLFYGVLSSTILGVVVYLMVKIITSLVVLVFKLRSYSLQMVSTMVHATHKRIQPTLYFLGLILWLVFTLRGFDVYDFMVNKVDHFLHIEWKVGEMIISLGGILSFMGIFIVSILIAKLVASIFQDEWMVKVLPKGVAPASSLLLRIILISIGLYMGLSAAGLDLSKLGFIIGTLGVGIGFGLQDVVLNFIAGLILAFERPINLGDTIEIDNEFGVVTNIGVRSSNIRNYSGSEAIVPNGDLISKKVINWTLSSRNRRSNILLKTAPDADPQTVIDMFNKIASDHPKTHAKPAPLTYFKGYEEDGNLQFQLWYWTTFSETLDVNHDVAMSIFQALKDAGVDAPAPLRRIVKD